MNTVTVAACAPPNVTIASPIGTFYTVNQRVAASYTCTSAGATIASCTGPVPNGSSIDTSSFGMITFTVKATDSNGNSSSSRVTYNVITGPAPPSGNACNGAYNGTFTGNLDVSAGQNCTFIGGRVTGNIGLTGGNLSLGTTTVGGNVHIHDGGTFSLTGTKIMGNLHIQDLPVSSIQDKIHGVTVNGNLQYEKSGAPLEIGSASGCPGNTVSGNLRVQNDTAPVSIHANTVTGNLHVGNNTAAIVIDYNVVANNLLCQGNTTITGSGNTALQKQGQCSGF